MPQSVQISPLLIAVVALLVACSAEPGAKAEPCTVEESAEGAVTIRCPDGSEVTMNSGGAGGEPGSCTVEDNQDGTVTILCPDGSSATISNGEDGIDGEDGTRVVWLEGTSCVTLRDAKNLEVTCLGGGSWSLDPDCSFERHTLRDLEWTLYSCPDGDLGPIAVERTKVAGAQLVAGLNHTCLLSADGELSCWGAEANPQITGIPAGRFIEVAMSYNHSCGLRPDRSATCWGADGGGKADAPPDERFTQIGVGLNHSCGLRQDGTTLCWGSIENSHPLNDPKEESFAQIAVGEHNTCGLRRDGSVSCWGSTSVDRGSPPDDERFLLIEAGAGHYCGIRFDRSVGCWGLDDSSQASPPADLVATGIASGFRHTCALAEDGKAVCWGDPREDRILAPQDQTFAALANGDRHGCGLTTRGFVHCWGDDSDGQATPPLPLACFPPLAAPAGEVLDGLHFQGWERIMDRLPASFDPFGEPDYTGTMTSVELPANLVETSAETFALDIEGLLEFEEDAIVTFRLHSDDGSKLFFDDLLTIDHDGVHASESKDGAPICVQKGWHRIGIHYFQLFGDADLSLQMSRDDVEFVPAGPFVHVVEED